MLKLEAGLALLATLCAIATYGVMSSDPAPDRAGLISILFTLDLLLLLPLVLLIGRRILVVSTALRRGSAGSRLHVRLALVFSIVAAVPPAVMAIASALFLELGLESWFSQSVRATVSESLAVAEAYVEGHEADLWFDTLGLAGEVAQRRDLMVQRPYDFQQFIAAEARRRNLDEAIVFNGAGDVFAQYASSKDGFRATRKVPEDMLAVAQGNQMALATLPVDSKIVSLNRLSALDDVYLFLGRQLDARALLHLEKARGAVSDYDALEGRREELHLQFNAIFLVVALVLVLVAMWSGLWFADRLVKPISALAAAAERVRQGDLTARIVGPHGYDEIGMLSRAFNRMTDQLEHQQRALVTTNAELDARMRFLEAVLGDVSAGVVGIRPDGAVDLANRSAARLLETDEDALIGRPLDQIVPELVPLLEQASRSVEGTAQGHVPVERPSGERILLARLTVQREAEEVFGYVLTFDDITEQLADQRNAAWSDVARRIAHEIKNPLTPIQLSAERLRRRYADLAEAEDKVFAKCTDTIIRQVGDLRRMVNEFSAFARMPEIRFSEEDLVEVVGQTVFLQEVATPDIAVDFQRPDTPMLMVCDGRLIAQALTNIMKNSGEAVRARIKREEAAGADPVAPGRIAVRLEQSGPATRLIVEDNGLGFPKDRHRLTEPYVTTRTKGTGLGLAIVKRIVEEHGGQLILQDREGGGARVVVALDREAISGRQADRGELGKGNEADEEGGDTRSRAAESGYGS